MCAGGVQVTQLTTRVSDLEEQVKQGEAQATALRAQHQATSNTMHRLLAERDAEVREAGHVDEQDASPTSLEQDEAGRGQGGPPPPPAPRLLV